MGTPMGGNLSGFPDSDGFGSHPIGRASPAALKPSDRIVFMFRTYGAEMFLTTLPLPMSRSSGAIFYLVDP